jgi:hypothetical protein
VHMGVILCFYAWEGRTPMQRERHESLSEVVAASKFG